MKAALNKPLKLSWDVHPGSSQTRSSWFPLVHCNNPMFFFYILLAIKARKKKSRMSALTIAMYMLTHTVAGLCKYLISYATTHTISYLVPKPE